MENCFDLLGITRTTCDCFGEIKTGYNISRSGLFLDSYISSFVDMKYNCDAKDFWELLVSEYENSQLLLKNDLRVHFMNYYQRRNNNFALLAGRKNQIAIDFSITEPNFKIITKNVKGYKLFLNTIGLITTKNGTFDVFVKKTKLNGQESILRQISVNTIYGRDLVFEIQDNESNPDPVILDCDGSTYEIYYDLGVYNVFYNTILNSCSSCNGDLQDLIPFLDRTLQDCNDDKANGFLLGISGMCDSSDLPCYIMEKSPEMQFYFAEMLALKTKIEFLSKGLNSGGYYSIINADGLKDEIDLSIKKYDDKMKGITSKILPTLPNTCFSLIQKSKLSIG